MLCSTGRTISSTTQQIRARLPVMEASGQPNVSAVNMGTLMPDNAMEHGDWHQQPRQGRSMVGHGYGTLDWFKQRRAFIYDIPSRSMTDFGLKHSEANGIND